MEYYKRISKILFFILFFTVMIFIDSFSQFSIKCKNIRENVLRLHIIANSDSLKDQEIKLKVRDRVLKEADGIFYLDDGILSAKDRVNEKLSYIEEIANNELQSQGVTEKATAEIVNMFFDTRAYENFTMPAGYYDAVRIIIGDAKGKNWWCVLYPNLCIPSASKDMEASLKTVFTDEELKIIESEPKYEIRFFMVELYEKIKSSFDN